MEIKVYDESGKVIRIIPMYQVGGPVLPQYTPTETSMYRPQQSANTSLDVSQRNLEFQNQRKMQNASLDFQRDEQLLRSYQNAVDNRFKQQTQERINKQLELQNERFKQEVLQNNNTIMDGIIGMDDNMFLPRDRAAVDQLLTESGLSDQDILNLDPSDTESIYKQRLKKRAFLATQKNGLDNQRKWNESAQILGQIGDVEKRAKSLQESGYLNEQQYLDYIKAYNNVTQKRQDWANGKIDFDITNDPDYQLISQYNPLIDQAEMQSVMDNQQVANQLAIQLQQHQLQKGQFQLEEDKQTFEDTKLMAPLTRQQKALDIVTSYVPSMTTISSINSALPSDKQLNFTDPTKLVEGINKFNQEDWTAVKTALDKRANEAAQSGRKLDINEEILRAYMNGDEVRMNELIELQKQITSAGDKTVTYKTDGSGNTIASVDKNGNQDYGGFAMNKDNQVTRVTFTGESYEIYDTGENKGKVKGIPDAELTTIDRNGVPTGYIKIKGDNSKNLDWLRSKFPAFDSVKNRIPGFGNLDDFPKESNIAPQGTFYEGGYLYLPADSKSISGVQSQGSSTSFGTGSTFFGPASSGSTTVPADAKSVL